MAPTRRLQWLLENWGPTLSELNSIEQLFRELHFDREVIILCVRW